MPFIHDDFLFTTKTASRLYHQFAEQEPIFDYHCHLSPAEIAHNRRFTNLFEIWLEGDHYKWRAMRANGVAERYCTGDASPFDKFSAWAKTVPCTLRNPLYHWTHLELKRYFGIDELLDEASAAGIWARANQKLATEELSAQGILKRFRVRAVCTTDDPVDDLSHHKALATSGMETRVFPAFRPDKVLNVHQPELLTPWLGRLSEASNREIARLGDLLDALNQRHEYFHALGCRLSDHGLNHCYADFCSEKTAAAIFAKARSGKPATAREHAKFAAYMMLFFGRLNAEKGWTMQLHLGADRNNNTRAWKLHGPDTGFDSVGDWPQAARLRDYLDRLTRDQALPKLIVYNLNPVDNYVFASLIGSFQDGTVPGRMQFGSGWWFLDQKEGMEWQLNALSNVGLLSRFVGMVTDSRSFMSYPRHEYFRRVLCNLLGRDMENGELPDKDELIGPMIRNICYQNAKNFLGLDFQGSGP